MAKIPPTPTPTPTFDGLTVAHINDRMGTSPLEKALTTAHLAQALGGSATSPSQGAAPQPATAPATESPPTPQKE